MRHARLPGRDRVHRPAHVPRARADRPHGAPRRAGDRGVLHVDGGERRGLDRGSAHRRRRCCDAYLTFVAIDGRGGRRRPRRSRPRPTRAARARGAARRASRLALRTAPARDGATPRRAGGGTTSRRRRTRAAPRRPRCAHRAERVGARPRRCLSRSCRSRTSSIVQPPAPSRRSRRCRRESVPSSTRSFSGARPSRTAGPPSFAASAITSDSPEETTQAPARRPASPRGRGGRHGPASHTSSRRVARAGRRRDRSEYFLASHERKALHVVPVARSARRTPGADRARDVRRAARAGTRAPPTAVIAQPHTPAAMTLGSAARPRASNDVSARPSVVRWLGKWGPSGTSPPGGRPSSRPDRA